MRSTSSTSPSASAEAALGSQTEADAYLARHRNQVLVRELRAAVRLAKAHAPKVLPPPTWKQHRAVVARMKAALADPHPADLVRLMRQRLRGLESRDQASLELQRRLADDSDAAARAALAMVKHALVLERHLLSESGDDFTVSGRLAAVVAMAEGIELNKEGRRPGAAEDPGRATIRAWEDKISRCYKHLRPPAG